ncbi:MAG: ABC transporter ATP-binding protein [Intestinimonas sp.]|jgi:ABC-type dipeptide/oligopeptide/nickel transport system ATPase component|nr:ABC transporter ATP-binding protein [Intestinimonas sp.]
MLEVKDLHVRFRSAPPDREAVSGVSFTIADGEILGLVGESGSGKTVTAMTISGLLSRRTAECSGSITLDGRELLQCSREELRTLQGADISVVFQEPMTALDPLMRIGPQVEESLLIHRPELSAGQRKSMALAAMADAELPNPGELYGKYAHELSGGMLQRVCIAAAVVSEPKLLLADEPTTALDVTTQAHVLELLRKINRQRGTAILFISHNLNVVRKLCSRVVVMCRGKVVEVGATEEVFLHPKAEYTRNLIAAIPRRKKL